MSLGAQTMPRLAVALCAALCLWTPSAVAQQPNVDFNVSGTSTVRGWTCSAKGVIAVTPGSGKPVPGFANGVQTATVTVPLKAFTCPDDEMRQHLLEAMKADKFPEIVFRLEKYDVTPANVMAAGAMTITGVTQPVSFPLVLKPSPQGVQVEGNTRLEFKTFGLNPPTVMLGMLKVGPQLRIEFKGLVAP
ncbi:MAG: YceI family protein [Vicinamibacterales bacterium]